MPLCSSEFGNSNLLRKNLTSSNIIQRTQGDSIGVLWAYMFIYILINLGVWGLIMWGVHRPHTNFGNPQKNENLYGNFSYGKIATGPQFLWDLKG